EGDWKDPDEDPWRRQSEPDLEQDEERPVRTEPQQQPRNRWHHALSAGLQAALWWMRRQHGARPVLTTAPVALAAGATVVLAAPAVAAGAVALASASSLLTTADSAHSATSCFGNLFS